MSRIDDMFLLLDSTVSNLMEERGIREADIRQAVLFAEGERLYHTENVTGRRLAAFSEANVTCWVEYLPEGDGYRIFRAYTHRMKILQGFNMPSKKGAQEIGWSCAKCGFDVALAAVKMTYLGETFIVDLPACPSCQRVLISEETAVAKMALAEQMLEDK